MIFASVVLVVKMSVSAVLAVESHNHQQLLIKIQHKF